MNYFGYAGNILRIDLTTKSVEIVPLDLDQVQSVIGGFGTNNSLAWDEILPHTDAFHPKNPIIFGAGVLCGTNAPGSVRLVGTTKYPISDSITSGSGSMGFASRLKYAGFDHVIINGKAPSPVYVHINNDTVRIVEAKDLWGKMISATTDHLETRHPRASAMVVGPAAENLSKWSLTMVDRTATLGRGGFGAVMGSKNLKAIVVEGDRGVRVADKKRFLTVVEGLYDRCRRFEGLAKVHEFGIVENWDNYLGQLTIGDWSREETDERYGQARYKEIFDAAIACNSCFVRCKDKMVIREGRFAGETWFTPSFLNCVFVGGALRLEDYREAAKLQQVMDDYGLCLMTFGHMLRYLRQCKENGLLPPEAAAIRLENDFETGMNLIDIIANRRGFGDILADGWTRTIETIGEESRAFVPVIKGLDCTFDPRLAGLGTMEFEQVVNPRGPQSAASGSPTYLPNMPPELFQRHVQRMGASPAQMERIFHSPREFSPGRLTRVSEDWYTLFNCLGTCNRHFNNRFYHIDIFAELYSAATGIEKTPEELMAATERVWNIHRMLNVREGFDRSHDTFPEQWFQPEDHPDGRREARDYYGNKKLTRADFEHELTEYYRERGWDETTGVPTAETLRRFGLTRQADSLGAME
jgi:aldehyde:ferredoxin oxidoreductase